MSNRPNILLVMTDEHSPNVAGFPGEEANNLVWMNPRPELDVMGHFIPFKDTNPQAKYPYCALGKPHRASLAKKLFAMHSEDGIHFELTQPEPVVSGYDTDSPHVADGRHVCGVLAEPGDSTRSCDTRSLCAGSSNW